MSVLARLKSYPRMRDSARPRNVACRPGTDERQEADGFGGVLNKKELRGVAPPRPNRRRQRWIQCCPWPEFATTQPLAALGTRDANGVRRGASGRETDVSRRAAGRPGRP